MTDALEIDERHLRRMLECLDAARRGKVTLGETSDSLLLLRDALETADRRWAEEFTSHLATLESASLASPAQKELMGEDYPGLISRTLDALEALVRARLQRQ